jgi:hypothetical protein
MLLPPTRVVGNVTFDPRTRNLEGPIWIQAMIQNIEIARVGGVPIHQLDQFAAWQALLLAAHWPNMDRSEPFGAKEEEKEKMVPALPSLSASK